MAMLGARLGAQRLGRETSGGNLQRGAGRMGFSGSGWDGGHGKTACRMTEIILCLDHSLSFPGTCSPSTQRNFLLPHPAPNTHLPAPKAQTNRAPQDSC